MPLTLVLDEPAIVIVAVRGAGERAQLLLEVNAAWQVLRALLLHQRIGAG